jgi:hypothetical protein
MHKIKMHTRDNFNRNNFEGTGILEEEVDEHILKIDSLMLHMCNGLYSSRCTLNMDNDNIFTMCAIRLQEKAFLVEVESICHLSFF